MAKAKKCSKKRTYKPQKVARLTNNGYLNFLRDFKKKHCGLLPQEMVMRGTKAWCRLNKKQKERYRKMQKNTNRRC